MAIATYIIFNSYNLSKILGVLVLESRKRSLFILCNKKRLTCELPSDYKLHGYFKHIMNQDKPIIIFLF